MNMTQSTKNLTTNNDKESLLDFRANSLTHIK